MYLKTLYAKFVEKFSKLVQINRRILSYISKSKESKGHVFLRASTNYFESHFKLTSLWLHQMTHFKLTSLVLYQMIIIAFKVEKKLLTTEMLLENVKFKLKTLCGNPLNSHVIWQKSLTLILRILASKYMKIIWSFKNLSTFFAHNFLFIKMFFYNLLTMFQPHWCILSNKCKSNIFISIDFNRFNILIIKTTSNFIYLTPGWMFSILFHVWFAIILVFISTIFRNSFKISI